MCRVQANCHCTAQVMQCKQAEQTNTLMVVKLHFIGGNREIENWQTHRTVTSKYQAAVRHWSIKTWDTRLFAEIFHKVPSWQCRHQNLGTTFSYLSFFHLYNKQAVQLSFLSPSFFQMTSDTVSLFLPLPPPPSMWLFPKRAVKIGQSAWMTRTTQQREFSRQQQTAERRLLSSLAKW